MLNFERWMIMITEDSLNKLYHLNFEKYKDDLRYFGVPLEIYKEEQIMSWFDTYLENITNNNKRWKTWKKYLLEEIT